MRGASIMSSMSALRSGVGLLTVASSWTCINNISYQIPEAITLPLATDSEGYILFEENRDILQKVLKSYDSILIGCGMGVTESTRNLTEFIIRNAECPVIIDADGINCIASCIDILSESKTDIILTPHPREMSRLCGTVTEGIQKNRIETAMNFAEKYGVTLVLKGAGTVTADSKQCMVNINGNPGMSRGGSGDVLAGIIASLSAQGYSAFDSCVYGVYIHGLAGDITAEKMGYEAMLPTDIIKNLSASFMSIK
ncbi:MAG: NAD(P)H-hydrate dehydratase [Ruminococcus sp.]|nr:NAD(P)H-hydrate dehydratase [Ruminococcus sp.]